MLVLSRKTHEKIQIGDNVTITIVRVTGQTVRVGIEAPKDVRVIRGELLDKHGKSRRDYAKETPVRPTSDAPAVSMPVVPAGPPCQRSSLTSMAASSPMSSCAVESQPLKGYVARLAGADSEAKSCVEGRRRVPGASLAPLMRRPQRLGPASVGALTGRLR